MPTITAADRIATALLDARNAKDMNGTDIADRIEGLTGVRPSPTWVSRRTGTAAKRVALLTVDPDLFLIAQALEIDREGLIEIVTEAIFGRSETDAHATTGAALIEKLRPSPMEA